jgi:hypothetical protein
MITQILAECGQNMQNKMNTTEWIYLKQTKEHEKVEVVLITQK